MGQPLGRKYRGGHVVVRSKRERRRAQAVRSDLVGVLDAEQKGHGPLIALPPVAARRADLLEHLREDHRLELELARRVRRDVAAARAEGHTWTAIAPLLGMTERGAAKKFGSLDS